MWISVHCLVDKGGVLWEEIQSNVSFSLSSFLLSFLRSFCSFRFLAGLPQMFRSKAHSRGGAIPPLCRRQGLGRRGHEERRILPRLQVPCPPLFPLPLVLSILCSHFKFSPESSAKTAKAILPTGFAVALFNGNGQSDVKYSHVSFTAVAQAPYPTYAHKYQNDSPSFFLEGI